MLESILIYLLIALGLGFGVYLLRAVVRIYQGEDGKFSVNEFQKMIGAFTLLGLSTYMVIMEANRTESWQLFGPLYIFFIIGGFLSVIGFDKVLDTVAKIWGKKNNDEPGV